MVRVSAIRQVEERKGERRLSFRVSEEDERMLDWYETSVLAEGA